MDDGNGVVQAAADDNSKEEEKKGESAEDIAHEQVVLEAACAGGANELGEGHPTAHNLGRFLDDDGRNLIDSGEHTAKSQRAHAASTSLRAA